jgi:hypothetical protein
MRCACAKTDRRGARTLQEKFAAVQRCLSVSFPRIKTGHVSQGSKDAWSQQARFERENALSAVLPSNLRHNRVASAANKCRVPHVPFHTDYVARREQPRSID